jgi:hypothetical protein
MLRRQQEPQKGLRQNILKAGDSEPGAPTLPLHHQSVVSKDYVSALEAAVVTAKQAKNGHG